MDIIRRFLTSLLQYSFTFFRKKWLAKFNHEVYDTAPIVSLLSQRLFSMEKFSCWVYYCSGGEIVFAFSILFCLSPPLPPCPHSLLFGRKRPFIIYFTHKVHMYYEPTTFSFFHTLNFACLLTCSRTFGI